LIYGPTLSKAGGFDACNGIIFDGGKADGVLRSYGYVATTTFPYLVGCFGPASYPSTLPTCTTNPPASYIPWKDLYTVPPAELPATLAPEETMPATVTMLVDSSGDSPIGEACADLKSMMYGDGVSVVLSQISLPYADHDILFPSAWETLPTVLSVELEINPLGNAAVNNVSASNFSAGVVAVTQTYLTVRITPIDGIVADMGFFQVKYLVQAARIGKCTLRAAMEHMRLGSMRNFQHLNITINTAIVTVTSALICNAGTGVNVAGSSEVTSGDLFHNFISSNPLLNHTSSHLHLPVITGTGFANSLYVAASGNCKLRYVVLQNGKGGRGGAVQVAETATLTLEGVILRNNISPIHGGGLFVASNSVVTITNSLFASNSVIMTYVGMSGGGAIYNRGTIQISDSTFYGNIVSSAESVASGGGLYNVGQATVKNCEFSFNEANGNMVGEGGAVSTYRNGTLLEVDNCIFVNNSATHGGGAAFAQGMIKMKDCVFTSNIAGLVGPTLRVSPDAPQPSMNNISVHNNVCESEYMANEGYGEFLKPDNFRRGPW